MYLVKKQPLSSGFELFNASAGSGKTYQLTKSYLKLILSNPTPQKFRQILALTFTNKAVAEMKNRILDSLYTFGNPEIDKKGNPLFLELVDELSLSPKELERKSSLALKLLLHNYNFFEVSTIDKFIHRVIRTFAKELKLSQSFEVELDEDMILDEAIGRLLQHLNENEPLCKVLIDFSLEKIKDEKSWNIIYDLKNIGRLLFRENHYVALQQLKNKSIKDFEVLKIYLSKKLDNLSEEATLLAQQALNTIYAHNFEDADFNRETLPNHFKKIIAGERSVKLYQNKLEDGLVNGSLLLKRVDKDGTLLFEELLTIYLKIKKTFQHFLFFKNAYSNVLPLTVLNEISKQVSALQKEKETLHISEFNTLIHKEIANQPAPYIYERLGERYLHYFIDEFQDTSKMQWQNLVPLIGNALETETLTGEKGTLLLVGDVKQSIYRWRGGDPNQLLHLNEGSLLPFTIAPEIKTLNSNWRSFDTIIQFNNRFFGHLTSYFKEPKFQNLYLEQCQQQNNHRKGGYIEIAFTPKEVEDDEIFYCENVLKTINRIITNGYAFEDICILVRKNKEGIVLANYLTENNVQVISSEALLLANNREIQFLVSLLRFLDNPYENSFQFNVLEYLFAEQKDQHDHIAKHLGKLPEFLIGNYGYNSSKEASLPLLDLLERVISIFLPKDCYSAHLMQFLDVALEVSEKIGVSIHEFLKYWDVKKNVLAISAPENQDAVQLMTVHKSKGLEFCFVVFPFADSPLTSRLHEKKLWVPINENSNIGFNEVLVNATKELQHYSEYTNLIYSNENNLSELDDINVLYVALTRAIEGLFIFTKDSTRETYGRLLKSFLLKENLWNDDTTVYRYGNFSKNSVMKTKHKPIKPIPFINSQSENVTISISSQSLRTTEQQQSVQWGNVIHGILSEINSSSDIDKALNMAIERGDINSGDFEYLKRILLKIVRHPKLSKFYIEGVYAKNEIEIMDAKGQLFRPDRLIFDEKNVTIIDYKTGGSQSNHQQQLHTYAHLLNEIGFIVVEQILVYIGDEIEPVFI